MPALFRHIMVPVDFTPKNVTAVNTALELAKYTKADLTFLHVIERLEQESDSEIQSFYQTLEGHARKNMESLALQFASHGWPIRQEVVFGHCGPEILEYSLREKVDLVVLSSHKVPLDSPQGSVGSLSHQISILSQCPVLLVK